MARKTKEIESNITPVLVNISGLQELCGCGRYTALKIADASGARVQVGRRVLFNREKIQKYMNSISIVNSEE